MTLRDALAAALHVEWERRWCEPGEPGVTCRECESSADFTLADPAFRAALTEAVAEAGRYLGVGCSCCESDAAAIVARVLGAEVVAKDDGKVLVDRQSLALALGRVEKTRRQGAYPHIGPDLYRVVDLILDALREAPR